MSENQQKLISYKAGLHTCKIGIGPFEEWYKKLRPSKRILFITDENIQAHYPSFLKDKEVILINSGEKSKKIEAVTPIYKELLAREIDRNSFIVGMGGGVVTDIAGFVASTFMRGLSFGFISTSLLGQVDAVIGGKNGVNLDGYKNLIGTINQPDFIINDPAFINTLPDQEFFNGSAEVIKQFLVADAASFHWLYQNLDLFLNKDPDFLFELIYRQSKIKVNVVQEDEKEKGKRKILNFGHSLGHAIEKESGIAHGFAVSIGMVYAIKISILQGYMDQDQFNKVLSVLEKCQLPITCDLSISVLMDNMKKDKKKKGDSIDYILLEEIGLAKIKNIPFDELENLLIKIESDVLFEPEEQRS